MKLRHLRALKCLTINYGRGLRGYAKGCYDDARRYWFSDDEETLNPGQPLLG